jgi:carbonic anhydrase/acetyltransferase-like protein (isoleucine patch superfamily)
MRAIKDHYIAHNAVVVGDVELGPDSNIWYGCIIRGDVAKITLGPRFNFQDGSILHADFDVPVIIEAGVVVGHSVMLHGRFIGRECLIGIGARLLAGTEIGAESIIAAGCVVSERKVIPPRSLVMGIPGKVVRQVTDEELARTRMINAHYIDLAKRHAAGEFHGLPDRQ